MSRIERYWPVHRATSHSRRQIIKQYREVEKYVRRYDKHKRVSTPPCWMRAYNTYADCENRRNLGCY